MGLAFVGQERLELVEQLRDEWTSCVREHASRLVVLNGHPGVGKTRVVQEFYEQLCRDQAEPAYWPPLIDDDEGSALLDRGRIRPLQFQCPPGARPSYAWVAVTCRLDDVSGLPTRALVDAVGASEQLLERVIRPIGRSRRLAGQAWRILMVLVGLAAAVLGLVGVGGPLVTAAGFIVAGTGLSFEMREQLHRTAQELSHRRRERTKQDVMIDVARPLQEVSLGAHARASGFLAALARRGIPGVVIIDDAHWADEDTVSLVEALLGRSLPVLIIATVRPNPFEDQLAQRHGLGRVVRDFEAKTTVAALSSLSELALIEAVRARAPRTSEAVLVAIAHHAEGNPLVLAGTLDQPLLKRALVGGAYVLGEPERELERFPSDPRGVFEAYWEQLPEDVRQVAAIAALQGLLVEPQTLMVGFRGALDADPRPAMRRAHDPHSWLVEVPPDLDRFADPILLDVTLLQSHGVISGTESRDARASMVAHVIVTRRELATTWLDLSDNARRVLLRLHVNAVLDGAVAVDHDAARSAIELAELTDGPGEASISLGYAERAVEWSGASTEFTDRCQLVMAKRLKELGRLDQALAVVDAHVASLTHSRGPTARDTLVARLEMVDVLRQIGRAGESLAQADVLLADAERVLGARDLVTLKCRRHRVVAMRRLARNAEAIELLRPLIDDDTDWLGPLDEETLLVRAILATAYQDLGQLDDALALFRQVHEGHVEAHGPDHPESLGARYDIATVLMSIGRLDDALNEARTVVSIRTSLLGPDHPETLKTRNLIATILWRLGRNDEAIEMAHQILSDRLRVLGSDHPSSLMSRNVLAVVMGASGRADEALVQFRELHQDQQRLLGPDHPETLRTRRNIGAALSDLERYDDAIDVMEELCADEQRILGAHHPDALSTRSGIAETLYKAGRLAESRDAYERVVADQIATIGGTHPSTLTARTNWGLALLATGDLARAREELSRVANDCVANLGEAHPKSVEALAALAQVSDARGTSEPATS